MDFASLLNMAKATTDNAVQKVGDLAALARDSFGSGVGFAQQQIGRLSIFGSNETVTTEFDEKHYFLIPFLPAETQHTLYSMRCLPEGVPPINDLPKKRVFHLPSEHSAELLRQMLTDSAVQDVHEGFKSSSATQKLSELADAIDQVDQKVFHGALLIGGLVALVNPVAGGVLAAKSLVPSVGLLLTRFGLNYAGDTLDDRALRSRIRSAEKEVQKTFQGTETTQQVDPLLERLALCLRTEDLEYDPLVDSSDEWDDADALTVTAILNVYQETMSLPKLQKKAGLGPEDVRWLQYLQTIQSSAGRS